MAALTPSAVTVLRSWTDGGVSGKERIVKRVSFAVTGQGTNTNAIPASAFGLRVIEECTNFIINAPGLGLRVAVPHHDGSKILLYDMNDATDATRSAPKDFTGETLVGTVAGY